MQTRKLYYEDCLLRQFSAQVVDCRETDKGFLKIASIKNTIAVIIKGIETASHTHGQNAPSSIFVPKPQPVLNCSIVSHTVQ